MARPTKYDPVMCEVVVDLMRDGASRVEVCAELDICYDTFLAWQAEHQEFSESVKRGVDLCQAWWEREGRTNLKDKDFSYTGWYMNMKNRFAWADRNEVKHSGEIQQVTDDQLDTRLSELIRKAGIAETTGGEGPKGQEE